MKFMPRNGATTRGILTSVGEQTGKVDKWKSSADVWETWEVSKKG